jgi:carboxymethylenebutenolidase
VRELAERHGGQSGLTQVLANERAENQAGAHQRTLMRPSTYSRSQIMSNAQVVAGTPDRGITQLEIDQRVFDLYDEYCHGRIDRREFLARAAALAVIGGLGMAQALLPRYAQAQTISFTDPRIKATYVNYASPGGNSGTMRGYLVQPAGTGPFPAVLVVHENRGLNPYIEDVARRVATEGFLALAPDGLFPVGGYPGNDDDGRTLQASLDQARLRTDMLNSARFIKRHSRR